MMENVFICADMEGVSGIVKRKQTDDIDSSDYARACELFTQEVKACVRACLENGIPEVVVADSHGPATNLDPRDFPETVRLVQGWPRPLNMMDGVQHGQFCAAILLGHHTAITEISGNFPHTVSSMTYAAIHVNNTLVSEAQLNTWVAGHFGIPVIVVSGDDAFVSHARSFIPNVNAVITKRASGMYSAEQHSPEIVVRRLQQAVVDALSDLSRFRCVNISGPIVLDLTFRDRFMAHVLSFLPIFEQVGSHALRLRCADIIEAVSIIGALPHLNASYD